jgi:O-antigen ligase
MSWRRLFPFVLLFSCVDGFISNYFYPAILPLLYRDFLILLTYFFFIQQEPFWEWVSKLRESLGLFPWLLGILFLLISALQVFNSNLPTLLVGLLGFKVSCLYWFLAPLAYAYATDLKTARKPLSMLFALSVPINFFGLYQFYAGPDFLVDTFGVGFERAIIMTAYDGAMNPEDFFLRIIGTFASSGQYANFLTLNIFVGFSLLLTVRTRRRRWLIIPCILLNSIALLATGSRGALLTLLGMSVIFAVLNPGIRRWFWVGTLVAAGLYFGFQQLGEAVFLRLESIQDVEMISNRTIETTPVMFMDLFNEAPFGKGMGLATGASRYLVGEDSMDTRLIENHPSKLQLETGIGGVLVFYAFVIALLLRWLTAWRVSTHHAIRDLTAPLSAYCLSILLLSFIIGGFDSPPQSVFFWTLVGTLARLSNASVPPSTQKKR